MLPGPGNQTPRLIPEVWLGELALEAGNLRSSPSVCRTMRSLRAMPQVLQRSTQGCQRPVRCSVQPWGGCELKLWNAALPPLWSPACPHWNRICM
eukprot:4490621-Alexandrium_andersonii.AAC.1